MPRNPIKGLRKRAGMLSPLGSSDRPFKPKHLSPLVMTKEAFLKITPEQVAAMSPVAKRVYVARMDVILKNMFPSTAVACLLQEVGEEAFEVLLSHVHLLVRYQLISGNRQLTGEIRRLDYKLKNLRCPRHLAESFDVYLHDLSKLSQSSC
jgi:hypothetical protein